LEGIGSEAGAVVGQTYGVLRDFTKSTCQVSVDRSRIRSRVLTACFAVAAVAATTTMSLADENGISFWIPGLFGTFAASPLQPGWSLTSTYYHDDVSASGNAALAREISIGQFNPKINININANVHAKDVDLGWILPTYVFATPFFGGQASASLLLGYGNNDTTLNATATASAGPVSVTKSIALQQDTTGLMDVIPLFIDRWNAGVNNYMVYLTGDIPVGRYSSSNLANIGLGHGAIDGGVGYTYLNEKEGHEFSAVAGLTGNFENPSTNYTSGIDFHFPGRDHAGIPELQRLWGVRQRKQAGWLEPVALVHPVTGAAVIHVFTVANHHQNAS
jgi:hypothetical protein